MAESLLTIGISSIALAVSLVALYAEFFRQRTRLDGLLVDASIIGSVWFEFALVNKGDVQILLREVSCDTDTMTLASRCEQAPSLIQPGEVKIIRLTLGLDEDSKLPGTDPDYVHFRFVSARGVNYHARHTVRGYREARGTMDLQGYWQNPKDMWLLFSLAK